MNEGATMRDSRTVSRLGVWIATLLVAALMAPGVGWAACQQTAVSGGGAHTLSLDADQTAWSWGANNRGQLGNGTNTDSTVPVHVSINAAALTYVSAGGEHSLALTTGGTVKSWGANG